MVTFLDVLESSSTTVWTRLDVITDEGATLQSVDFVDGQVTVDKGRACRRECSVTIPDPDSTLVPAFLSDLFHPMSGNQLRLLRGAYDPTGANLLYYPLGTFTFNRPNIQDRPDGLIIQITGQDRAKLVQEGRLTDVLTVASGTDYVTAIQTLVSTAYPLAAFNSMGTTRTTPQLVFEPQADLWAEAQKMAAAIGAEIFFDPWGYCTIQAEPAPSSSSTVSATYAEGDTAMLTGLTKDLDAESAYNYVVVSGEHSENAAPVRAVAYDDNPSSPTYYQRRVKPKFYSSAFITSAAQAQEAADAILRRSLGVSENVELEATVNPALDVGQVIRIVRGRARVDALYVIDRLTLPLRWDRPMQVGTRRIA